MIEALDFALETARRAGDLLLGFYDQHHTVRHKTSDIDVVTEADLASEELILRAIRSSFPAHDILSEEGGGGDHLGSIAESDAVWLVDPLDGTVNYAHGHPLWGVSLALAQRGAITLGVTHDPLLGETFWAERGKGAYQNGRRLSVSAVATPRDALVATGFPYKRATMIDNNLAQFGRVMPRVQGIRRGGAAVLDLAYVAAGRLDGYWEMHLKPWDWATGWLLVNEAGGVVTDLCGEAWHLGKDRPCASNGLLHAELLGLLQGQ